MTCIKCRLIEDPACYDQKPHDPEGAVHRNLPRILYAMNEINSGRGGDLNYYGIYCKDDYD